MSSQNRNRQLSLFGLVLLFAGLVWVLAQTNSAGLAAATVQPEQQNTPTRTPTATSTPRPERAGTNSESTFNGGPNPLFVGFGSSVLYSSYLPELCAGAVVPEDGEAWVLSDTQIRLTTDGATLYIQRCVGSIDVWEFYPIEPRAFELILPSEVSSARPPILPPLERMPSVMAQPPGTPIPTPARPALEPLFPVEPLLPVIPTMVAPERFDRLPAASITLRTPGGELIPLENEVRPDLWIYHFPVSSESGEYTVLIRSGGEEFERPVQTIGEPRVFFMRQSTGAVSNRSPRADDVVVHFAGFAPERMVTARLYGIVAGDPVALALSEEPVALTEIGRWTFNPAQQGPQLLSDLLRRQGGPPIGNFIVLVCYSDECNNLPLITPFGLRWPDYVFASIYVEPSAAALTFPPTLDEIRFARGATGADVDLHLAGRDVEGYRLGIAAGQRLMLSANAPDLYAYVLDPDGNLISSEAFGAGEIPIAQDGVYTILVYGRVDARMHVEIPPR